MTEFTIRAITATAGSAASCAVSTEGGLIERPTITRARPKTAPSLLLVEALSEALDVLQRGLKPGDFVTIEFAGVKSTEIEHEHRLVFRKRLAELQQSGADFAIVEIDETPTEMARLRDNASFAAAMGLTGMSR